MLVYLLLALFLTCSPGILVESLHTYSRRNSTGLTDEVTWDPYSLSIHGQRVFILAAEVHPWRIPGDPAIWADIFQKVKANGFNTVSFYVNWALHYPAPDTNGGRGDFEEGTYRNIQGFIDQAKKAGLWMIARPGPYINGETTGGGFPGWVGNIAGNLRSNNPNYTEAWTPYLTSISKIIAKNQITNGGPIILVQAENEYSESAGNDEYMQAIIDLYRDNGIVIPTTHNDQHSGQAGNFSPDRPGLGRVNIYCGDSYPQGSNRWAQVQSIYYSAHQAVAPSNPLCLAEFGGGFLLQWGSVTPRGGTGYEKYSNANGLTDATYEDVFYKENYAQTATILNIYMLFGGTNWGQTAAPVSYTSYDYGGGINENRVANTKMNEMRLQGLFLRVSRNLLSSNLIANSTNYTTSSLIHTAELRNPITGAAFYVTRHNDSTSTELTTTQIRVNTSQGSLLIPQTGVLTFNGRESKIIVTDYVFGRSSTTILYSTAEIMTWTTIGDTDYLILYAPEGQTGETAFLLSTELKASNLQDAPGATATLSDGRLTLQYTLKGSQFIPIQLQSTKFVVILLDKATAYQWHAPIIEGSGTFGNFFSIGTNETVLVGGPYVLRSSSLSRNTLELTGDLNGTTSVEFIAPSSISRLSWNGKDIPISKSSRGTFVATIQGANVGINLPTLGDWKVSGSLPEIEQDFDDSQFVLADIRTTNYTDLPPLFGDVVLYSQQYGFYGGNLIFRGHFEASGNETTVKLAVQYGFAGGYTAWLNGVFLGSGQGNSTVSLSEDSWAIPANTLQVGKDNVLVVVQDHTGISETSTNSGKEPRGIRGYAIEGGNATFTSWRLQGNQGGAANTPDTYRGYLNEGGLYAERIGAHLPGYPDVQWKNGTPLSGGGLSRAGINFYRTTFDLRVPDGVDFPIRLSITPSDISSNFRVQIYLNGWQVGKYINNIGPQTDFVLPASVLRRSSTNTLSLSLWSLDNSGASIASLRLISDGIFSTSLVFNDYRTPDYIEQQKNRPSGTYYEPM
ncbi:glycoside hydrolase family 35 protein [Armillaria borealis]|uniref:Beta-galactosidase n=1 Tax=Armillaria borealis TaxID=47425 RepID=A0AA39JB03_9AGAR|nr:glycoside hydrolase family 35 protein [Armillaria borealis]